MAPERNNQDGILVNDDVVQRLGDLLVLPSTSLTHKYRILFALRNLKGIATQQALEKALKDPSALLRHEVAYCLGQRQDPAAVQLLTRTLRDEGEHPMVRHEAGEALGALATPDCLAPLRDFAAHAVPEVAQTCQLALQRVEHFSGAAPPDTGAALPLAAEGESRFLSVDPTPAAAAGTPVATLRRVLLDEGARMFDRYAAMFALRNAGGGEAVEALGAAFACSSALLKHEVAYVLGQMQDAGAVQVLRRVLEDRQENAMVRHEAAEALGSIADSAALAMLRQYAGDEEPIVAHSCEVALDMLEFEAAGGFDYMDIGSLLREPAPVQA